MNDLKIQRLYQNEWNEEIKKELYNYHIEFGLDEPRNDNFDNMPFYKLVIANETIGCVGLTEWENGEICLCYLYIRPQYQNQGFGKKFIDLLSIKFGKLNKNARIIYLYCHPDNEKALQLYKHYLAEVKIKTQITYANHHLMNLYNLPKESYKDILAINNDNQYTFIVWEKENGNLYR